MKLTNKLGFHRSGQESTQERRIKADVKARQRPKGRPVLMVLVSSLALLTVYLVGVLLWSGATSPSNPRDDTTAGIDRDPTAHMREISPANPAYPVLTRAKIK